MKMLHKSISDCDIDLRTAMYRNVLLSGGCTLLPGLDSRLRREFGR